MYLWEKGGRGLAEIREIAVKGGGGSVLTRKKRRMSRGEKEAQKRVDRWTVGEAGLAAEQRSGTAL